jgi:hypothetical protein
MTVLCISTLVFKNLSKIQIIDIFLSILSKINKYLILTSKQKMFYLYFQKQICCIIHARTVIMVHLEIIDITD